MIHFIATDLFGAAVLTAATRWRVGGALVPFSSTVMRAMWVQY